jgi:acyl-CoA thioesterase
VEGGEEKEERMDAGEKERGPGTDLEGLKQRLKNDPFARYLGIQVLGVGEGWSKVEMSLRPEMVNFMGSIHGGAIFSLADHAFAAACNSHGTVAVALHVDITFFSVPPLGSILKAEAREIHLSRRTATYSIEISTGEGDRVASFQGVAYRKSKEHGA